MIVGNTSTPQGDKDILVTKYDADGNQLWQQTFGGTAGSNDYGLAVRVDNNYAVIVAGSVINNGSSEDIAVAKYDASGALEWTQTWDGGSNGMDFPTALTLDGSGNVYLAGASISATTSSDYAVLRIDGPTGNVDWTSSYNYNNLPDYATSLVLDGNGDLAVTGASANSATLWDYATVIFNRTTGAQMAVSRVAFPGIGISEPSAIAKDAAGNIIIVGTDDSAGNKNIQTVKLSPQMAVLWTRGYYGEGLEDKGLTIGVTAAGDVYVAGYTQKASGGSDFITLKYDPAGALLWDRRYQSQEAAGIARASQLTVTADGGCKVVGTVEEGGSMNARSIAYSPDGELIWEQNYNSAGNDAATSVLTDGDNVYVSGLTQNLVGNNYATIKYSVYRDGNPYHLDSAGKPDYVDHEVIISFRPEVVSQTFVSNRDLEFARLQDVVPDSVVSEMSSALGVNLDEQRITVMKIHRWMTPADSLSISRLGDTVRMEKLWSSFVMTLPTAIGVDLATQNLDSSVNGIDYTQPNHLFEPNDVPNDPFFATYQSSLIANSQFANASINMDDAWDIETGKDYIKVGIFDFPVDWSHPDFGNTTYAGSKIKGGVDWWSGTHISNAMAQQNSTSSHGTACAGIIGALRHNNTGIAGIAGGGVNSTGVPLYSYGIFNGNTSRIISESVAAAAITHGAISTLLNTNNIPFNYALGLGYGLHVESSSWSSIINSPSFSSFPLTLWKAVKSAWRNKCVFIASRGNNGNDALTFPACFSDEEMVLNVGVSGEDGKHMTTLNSGTGFRSSYGGNMDIIAPGDVNTVGTTISSSHPFSYVSPFATGYSAFRGTSASAPHVAGVAALMLSRHHPNRGAPNGLSPEDIENLLQNRAVDVVGGPLNYPAGYDIFNGHGMLNATAALMAVEHPKQYVLHSGSPGSNFVTNIDYNVLISFPSTTQDYIQGGLYVCDRHEITHIYSHTFAPGVQIQEKWQRKSSALGMNQFGSNDWYQTTSFFTQQNSSQNTILTSTLKTYVYKVKNKVFQPANSLNVWVPCHPSSAKTAFSIHLLDPSATGIKAAYRAAGFDVFPNPATETIRLRYIGERLQNPVVEVVDVAGRTIYRQAQPGWHATLNLDIPAGNWNTGMYFCRLISANRGMLVEKISKQ